MKLATLWRYGAWVVAVGLLIASLVEGIWLAVVAGSPVSPPEVVAVRPSLAKSGSKKRDSSKKKRPKKAGLPPAVRRELGFRKSRPESKTKKLAGPKALKDLPRLKVSPNIVPMAVTPKPIEEIEKDYPTEEKEKNESVRLERKRRRLERIRLRIKNLEERIARYEKEGKPETTLRRMRMSLERQKRLAEELEKELNDAK